VVYTITTGLKGLQLRESQF